MNQRQQKQKQQLQEALNEELWTIQRLSKESGYTEQSIYKKMEHGKFLKDVHYLKAPDGKIHFIKRAYYQWLTNTPLESVRKQTQAFISALRTTE